jgi:membrane fusion protein (multidrug efflux system)
MFEIFFFKVICMEINRQASRLAVAGLLGIVCTVVGCKPPSPPPKPIPEVAFQTVVLERAVLTTELPGRTSAYLVAEIRPQVNGIIQKRFFQEGANVKAGSILYQIDPAPYRAAVNQAEASLAASEAGLSAVQSRADRLQKLVKTHAVGEQEADEAQANNEKSLTSVAVAKAALVSARVNLAYTPIKAPITGRIGMSNVTVGGMVTAYQPAALAMIQQLDPIYVDVTQSSAERLRLRRSLENGHIKSNDESSKKVKLILEDGTQYPLEGKLQFRDVTVESSTGAVTLRLVFPNPNFVLLPGMFVRAVVEDGIDEHAILAMQQGITRDTKGNAIALVLDSSNKVEQRTLVADRTIGDKWLVTSGLVPGDRVIVEGSQKVRPGLTVKAVPYSPQSSKPAEGSGPSIGKK